MAVIGCHDNQGFSQVHGLNCCGNGLVELLRVVQSAEGATIMVRVIDAAGFDHQEIAVVALASPRGAAGRLSEGQWI